jgi:hypothetical protein
MSEKYQRATGDDRGVVLLRQEGEISYLMQRHGVTREEAKLLIRRHGGNRTNIEAALARRRNLHPTPGARLIRNSPA